MYWINLTSTSFFSLKLYLFFLKVNIKGLTFKIVFFPTKKTRITLLRSPNVFKKFKDHFEINKYKACVLIKPFSNEQNNLYNKLLKFVLINKPKNISVQLLIKE